MLFKDRHLQGLADGTITLAYRRWNRARVKIGSRLRTSIGVVAVESIETIAASAITPADAKRAGYTSPEELLRELDAYGDGAIHRMALRVAGPDPRIELRGRDALDEDELGELKRRLARLDGASRQGSWTRQVLETIDAHPEGTRAAELATALAQETLSFKRNVRKLKELGLTESLGTGYRIAPRGRALLRHFKDDSDS